MGRCRRSTRSRRCAVEAIELLRVPMRAGHPAAHRRRRARPSATCSSCTCGPPRRRAGPSARSSRSPPTRPSSPTPRCWRCATTSCPRALRRARPATPLALGPLLDAVRGPPDGARRAGAGGARRPAPRRRSLARRRGSAPPPPRCRAGAALGPARRHRRPARRGRRGAGGRRGAAAGEDRPRPRRRAAAGAARPRRRRRHPAGRRQRLLHARTTPSSTHLDDVGLACLEQPLAPDDLLGHARLAARLDTPICLDEPLTSLGAIEAAIALGACEVVCLKPARVGGWIAARAVHDRCAELGVPVWVGGMLETGVGRAANLAVAALPTWPCRRTSTRAVASTPISPTPACPVDGARAGAHRARHRRRPRRARRWPPPRSWEPGRRERAARHPRRRARRRRAHRRRRGAHAERPVAHAVGGARHRDRREVREPAVHRGLQGARRAQQAPDADRGRAAVRRRRHVGRQPRPGGGPPRHPARHRGHHRDAGAHAVREGAAHRGARRPRRAARRRPRPRPPPRRGGWPTRAARSCTPTTTPP